MGGINGRMEVITIFEWWFVTILVICPVTGPNGLGKRGREFLPLVPKKSQTLPTDYLNKASGGVSGSTFILLRREFATLTTRSPSLPSLS